MNPTDTLIVIEGPKGSKVHKAQCKRYNASKGGHSYGSQPGDRDVPSATCCKPSDKQRTELLGVWHTEAAAAVTTPTMAKPVPAAKANAGLRRPLSVDTDLPPVTIETVGQVQDGKVTMRQVAGTKQDGTIIVTDAASLQARNKAARAEHKALQAWKDSGEQGQRPSTANLEAVQADSEAGKTASQRVNGSKAKGTPRVRSERATQAAEAKAKANGKRGKGVKYSDEQVAVYLAAVLAEHPDTVHGTERQFFYWVLGGSYPRDKFAAAFEVAAEAARKAS